MGANWNIEVVWKDSNGTVIPLTGYSAVLSGKANYQDAVALFTLTSTPAAGIVITPALGKLVCSLTAAQTALFCPIKGVYDLLLTDGAGVKTRLIAGTLTITPRVS